MDYKVRTTKTGSGKKAVQVVSYFKRKTIILNHIGSGDNPSEIAMLKKEATSWIENEINKQGLFRKSSEDQFRENYEYLGFIYRYGYQFLERIYLKFNFHKLLNELFKDLVLVRILEPGSKKNNLEFLSEFTDKEHSLNSLYKQITKYDDDIKDELEKAIIVVAKKEFSFDFSFVLYDVTTLYFESFKDDEFKKVGFSKDNKSNQPQVVIGLIVTKEGFPISYQVFKGNTFEGNTFLPIILDFKNRHDISSLTVVADSAMLSKVNLETLVASGLNYIVGARLASGKRDLIEKIDERMKRQNGESIRLGDLIVEYSSTRYLKDKKELDKQVEKAKKYLYQEILNNPRIKYLKYENTKSSLNADLIKKNTKLLGLKGYTTNLSLGNKEIVDYYHNLHKVEHAWRIAKSDLEARPVYHYKEESIKNHILICFLALAISSYLELKNKISIARVVHILKDVTDAKILDRNSGEVIFQRKKVSEQAKVLENLSY